MKRRSLVLVLIGLLSLVAVGALWLRWGGTILMTSLNATICG